MLGKNRAQCIDMHMHTTASDGTDEPGELLDKVRAAGIGLFAVTDHDAVKSCAAIRELLREGDPYFINGVEFSCRDENGKYHILGYAYDIRAEAILRAVEETHRIRMEKTRGRLDFLEREFGFAFPQEALDELLALDNPGKPHIGNLMVKCGFAPTKDAAIREYINKVKLKGTFYIRPETAIRAILESGGIPVLAHAVYGDGNQMLDEVELDRRIRALMEYGLQGLECYYSGFTKKMERQMLDFADRYNLFASAGSDYHGGNKKVPLGDTKLGTMQEADPRLLALAEACIEKTYGNGR